MILNILGKNIRANLHRSPNDTLEPVVCLHLEDPENSTQYGFGAIVRSKSQIHYSPHKNKYGECWIEAEEIEIFTEPLPEPLGQGYYISTNTNHAKSNRKSLRELRDKKLKLVLAVRNKRHSKAQLTESIETNDHLYIIYASPHNQTKPLPCGARVFGFTRSNPLTKNTETHEVLNQLAFPGFP